MRRTVIKLIAAASLSLAFGVSFASSAMAQNDEDCREGEGCYYNFSDDVVEGELVRPDGELIEGQRSRNGSSLITVREHFIDELIESVEEL